MALGRHSVYIYETLKHPHPHAVATADKGTDEPDFNSTNLLNPCPIADASPDCRCPRRRFSTMVEMLSRWPDRNLVQKPSLTIPLAQSRGPEKRYVNPGLANASTPCNAVPDATSYSIFPRDRPVYNSA